MDEGESVFGDSIEPFQQNEAISAVADDGFLEEEDDDYEDLYNDVNVGEGFLQSLRKNEDLGLRSDVKVKVEPSSELPASETSVLSIPGVGSGQIKLEDVGGSHTGSRVSGRLDGIQNVGYRGNELVGANGANSVAFGGSGPPSGGSGRGGGLRVELGQMSQRKIKLEQQDVHTSVGGQVIPQANKMIKLEEQDNQTVVGVQGIPQAQKIIKLEEQASTHPSVGVQGIHQAPFGGPLGNVGNEGFVKHEAGFVNGIGGNGVLPGGGGIGGSGGVVSGGSGGGTILFIGDLHWWTTDAELESELCKYGVVKEVKFFDEKASGKSKGYCQAEFYDPAAATACKEGMNGHGFNGRPCVVAFASPFSVKRMGEAQVNRSQQGSQSFQPRKGPGDAGPKSGGSNIATGGNYQGGENNNRGYGGRGNWGRGNGQGMGNRGPVGPMRNRSGNMGGRGIIGNGGNSFGQGIPGTPPMMHPQSMMGPAFDPAFVGPMGRMGNYGGFPVAPTPPFSGILSSFPPMGGVGLPGVAPHVNPAFFGRGAPMNGLGMMPAPGVENHNMGMWSDSSMGGWTGDEHGGTARAGESSYGEDAVSEHQYGEVTHDRGPWPNSGKEDRVSERDWPGSSDRRYRDDRDSGHERDLHLSKEKDLSYDLDRKYRDDREPMHDRDTIRDRDRERERSRDRERERDRDRDRDRNREDRDRHADHRRYRDRDVEHDEWDRGRASRTHSKARLSHEDDQRSRSRDADYGKRRRE